MEAQINVDNSQIEDNSSAIKYSLTEEQRKFLEYAIVEMTKKGLTSRPCKLYHEIEQYLLSKDVFPEYHYDFYIKLKAIRENLIKNDES